MERYKQYKYEDVGVYIKPEIDDSELHIQTKVNILTEELYDYGCESITMLESNVKGDYTKLEELIEKIEWFRVSAVIIWSYSEIEEELRDKLRETCYKNGIEINAYKEDIQSLLFD